VANRIWGQMGYQFYDRFLEELSVDYGAALAEVDFRNDTEAARLAINAWVEEKTRDRIKNIVPPGSLDRLSTLVLVNAIYFKAQWMDQFSEGMTTEEPFWRSATESVPAPLMRHTDQYGYLETDDAQILELPYRGGVFSMLVYLPKERGGLAELEQKLSVDRLIEDVQDLPRRRVQVSLPRFEITSSFPLAEILKQLGMTTAFVADVADFTRMSQNPDLFISEVLHKAFVKVDENGTEAAAATAVMMKATGMMDPGTPVTFRADHPFLFVIRYNGTGSILFMGRVSDPTA
jgi:serpin B